MVWPMLQEDSSLASVLQKANKDATQLHIVRLDARHNALELWEPICAGLEPRPTGPILLLPPEYDFLEPNFGPQELYGIAKIGAQVTAAAACTTMADAC